MDATRWQRIERLFHTLLECDDDTRRHVLLRDAGDDPSLVDEVAAMLAAHSAGHGLALERALLHEDHESSADPAAGTVVGPYRLIERIGHGGMGVVYLAERCDGEFEQTVAVKLVRGTFVTPALIRRFRAERQILATLQHDGIARLLDGGVTPDGTPWLAMEHVTGLPITEHCDREKLSIELRLRLFRRVCGAVHYAHQNLVVHRDLKPSNILVTPDGAVKLLDFGIAKLLDEAAEDAAAGTIFQAMTPDYASPEQVRGEPVTTATDQYALGLLLFELLTGTRAQRMEDTSISAVQRTICEDAPCQPSRIVMEGSTEEVQERSGNRSVSRPERLRRRLEGDLDTIVTTALRKEPGRRYASVEQFSADVERHLTGLPVIARADTFGYRASRFVRRNRTLVVAAALVLLSLATGLALALEGLQRARAAEQRALAEAASANSVATFLVELFRANDPARAHGDSLSARALLERGSERIRSDLTAAPEVRARLLRSMGQAWESLGFFEDARDLYSEAALIQRSLHGQQSIEYAGTLALLADAVGRVGDYARSRELATDAVAIWDAHPESSSAALADALSTLGAATARLGDLENARLLLERAVRMHTQHSGPASTALASTLNNLAIVHWMDGDPGAARPLFERAVAIMEREYGADNVLVANTLNNLALTQRLSGQLDEAIATHRRVLAIREAALQPEHPDIAESLNNLGVIYLDRDLESARSVLERALAIRERALPADHEHTASTRTNLGIVLLRLGRPSEARPLLRDALGTLERKLGSTHIATAQPLFALAQIYAAEGNIEAAEAAFARTLAVREAALPFEHPALQETVTTYAQFLRDRGRASAADSLTARLTSLHHGSDDDR